MNPHHGSRLRAARIVGLLTATVVLTVATGWFVVYGLIRTADVASAVPSSMIGLTLSLYVALYLALIVAYVGVLKYMAEKPELVLATEEAERAATPPGAITAGGAAGVTARVIEEAG